MYNFFFEPSCARHYNVAVIDVLELSLLDNVSKWKVSDRAKQKQTTPPKPTKPTLVSDQSEWKMKQAQALTATLSQRLQQHAANDIIVYTLYRMYNAKDKQYLSFMTKQLNGRLEKRSGFECILRVLLKTNSNLSK